VSDYRTASDLIKNGGDALNDFSSTTLPVIAGHPIALNLPALVIVAAVTVILIYGIRESAKANAWIVIVKLSVVLFFISFGAFMVHPTNWHPYVPNGFAGVMSGAAIIFFAFIGFDAVSTTAEETRNPKRDMPIGIIASLIICTLLYVLMGMILTGIKKYSVYLGDPAAAATAFASKRWGPGISQRRRTCRNDFCLAGLSTRAAAHFHGDGAGWVTSAIFRENSSALSHSTRHDNLDRCCGRRRGDADRHRIALRPDQHRNVVCIYFGLYRRGCFEAN
jgi:Amino acid permease